MKPIDKKDQPKLFALIGVAVVAFGFGIFQLTGSSTAKPTAPKPSASPAAQTAAGGVVGPDGVVVDDGTWKPDTLQVLPTGGRDPFMPEGASAPQPSPSPSPRPTPTPPPATGGTDIGQPPPTKSWKPGGPGVVVIPPPTNGEMKVTLIKATPKPLPPAPTLDLSGVLVAGDDSRSKAIFKSNDRNTILGIGDAVGNGWRVSGIQEGKVEIIDPKTGRRAAVELK